MLLCLTNFLCLTKFLIMKYKLIKQITSKENRQSLKEAFKEGIILFTAFILFATLSFHTARLLWIY